MSRRQVSHYQSCKGEEKRSILMPSNVLRGQMHPGVPYHERDFVTGEK